eukprot:6193153-Pleurochrysis_carterae.AAC.1
MRKKRAKVRKRAGIWSRETCAIVMASAMARSTATLGQETGSNGRASKPSVFGDGLAFRDAPALAQPCVVKPQA